MTNVLQTAVHVLVIEFVHKQSLVLQAMRDLRPDIVMRYTGDGTPEERARLTGTLRRRPARGTWGNHNEWEYFLHGGGCRLTHTVTCEQIEWDVGALNRFDRSWFVNYVDSMLNREVISESISVVKSYCENADVSLEELLFSVLAQLSDACILSTLGSHNRYTLLST